jgi:predicted transcriptional regulator
MPDEPGAPVDRAFATRIVAAYVHHHQLSADQIGTLISTVHQALGQLGKPVEPVSERIPAVTIRRSVQHDRVTCLECGWAGSMLRRHLTTAHGLGVDEYRARWNLPRDHAMTAPAYSERRSTMAKQLGLGRGRMASREAPEPVTPETPAASQPRRRGRPRSKTTTAPA